MVVNYGTPSPTRPGHCQQLQLLNWLFIIYNLILTAVLFVNSCKFYPIVSIIKLLRSTKWNASLILLRDYGELVALCKVIG